MGETEISWTHRPGTVGRTWNPVQGCSRISPGCQNCYAERLAARFAETGWSKGLINLKTRRWNGAVRLAGHKLAEPLSWRKPATVFANSMSDLFHDGFSNEQIAAVFGVMAACPQHIFQVLTKRAKRMREWFAWVAEKPTPLITIRHSPRLICRCEASKILDPENVARPLGTEPNPRQWPLPSVWLGVSVENQDAADERIPELLGTPAAVRFLSCEPLLGLVDLAAASPNARSLIEDLDWVIAGCESGPGARPCHIDRLRSLRDQCAAAGVPFFLKQASPVDGSWATGAPRPAPIEIGQNSKRKAGGVIELPYLDGVQHAAFPISAEASMDSDREEVD